jgi:hypothetical protein
METDEQQIQRLVEEWHLENPDTDFIALILG